MSGLFQDDPPAESLPPPPPEGPGLFGDSLPAPPPGGPARSGEQAAPAEPTHAAAYRVLARKYRPTTFDDLIGQETMVRILRNAFALNRVAHAFMLTGVRGVGKTTTARIIARALNCIGPDGQGGPTADPCGVCPNCVAILADRHPDVVEMDAASRTGVDDVREVIEATRYRPIQARTKVFVVDEVHMLSRNAFNALLKTLEEPPPHVKFVFATTELRKVPITVLSRCQRFDLRRVRIAELIGLFASIAVKEGVTVEPAALEQIARTADGSVRDGLSLLDQAIAQADGTVTNSIVTDMLGLADRGLVFDLFEAVMAGNPPQALEVTDRMYERGADLGVVLQDLLEMVHTLTRLKSVPALRDSQELPEIERVRGAALADRLSVPTLTRCWQMLLKGVGEVEAAPDRRAAAEMVLIRLCHVSDMPLPGDLVRRLTGAPLNAAPASAAPASAAVAGGASANDAATGGATAVDGSVSCAFAVDAGGGAPPSGASASDVPSQVASAADASASAVSTRVPSVFDASARDALARDALASDASPSDASASGASASGASASGASASGASASGASASGASAGEASAGGASASGASAGGASAGGASPSDASASGASAGGASGSDGSASAASAGNASNAAASSASADAASEVAGRGAASRAASGLPTASSPAAGTQITLGGALLEPVRSRQSRDGGDPGREVGGFAARAMVGGAAAARAATFDPAATGLASPNPTSSDPTTGVPAPVAADPICIAASPPAPPHFTNFREVAAFVAEQRQAMLHAHLLHSAHLVRFSPPVIELRPEAAAPKDLAPKLAALLTEATGTRWTIALSTAPGEPTLAEQGSAADTARRASAADHPLVRAILDAFPGARIDSVHDASADAYGLPVAIVPATDPDDADIPEFAPFDAEPSEEMEPDA